MKNIFTRSFFLFSFCWLIVFGNDAVAQTTVTCDGTTQVFDDGVFTAYDDGTVDGIAVFQYCPSDGSPMTITASASIFDLWGLGATLTGFPFGSNCAEFDLAYNGGGFIVILGIPFQIDDLIADFHVEASCGGVLPVQFSTFLGSMAPTANNFSFQTVQETNCGSFYLERSEDGAEFKRLSKVACQGPSMYSLSDPYPPAKAYYRITQVDMDGKIGHYSQVVELKRPDDSKWPTLAVYPNPTSGPLSCYYAGQATGSSQLQVFEAQTGRLVKTHNLQQGMNSLDITELPAGVYAFVVGSQVKKVVKL